MMKYLSSKLLFLSVLSILFTSCADRGLSFRPASFDAIAKANGFSKKLVKGDDFWLTTYQKITNKNLPYVFYIEGDGKAFLGRYKISDNPTPSSPMVLKLAAVDKRPNVVYIARPCQFTEKNLNYKCNNNSYWANLRMSEEVVHSINSAINFLNNERPFSIVGYSGGGGIAVLIAAKNPKVKDIITLAGNLDIAKFRSHHNVAPMIGSLNPIDYATKVKNIPQIHISGGRDKIVPVFVADRYVQASNSMCVKQHIFDTKDHSKGWENVWEYVLNIPLLCGK